MPERVNTPSGKKIAKASLSVLERRKKIALHKNATRGRIEKWESVPSRDDLAVATAIVKRYNPAFIRVSQSKHVLKEFDKKYPIGRRFSILRNGREEQDIIIVGDEENMLFNSLNGHSPIKKRKKEGEEIRVYTVCRGAPIARYLKGRRKGYTFSMDVGSRTHHIEILSVGVCKELFKIPFE